MNFASKFDIGDTVVLKHDNDKYKRMITGISFRNPHTGTYCLSFGEKETWHYEYELEVATSETKKVGFTK